MTLDDRMAFFRQRCAQEGLAFTHQRQLIYRAIAACESHPCPEAVFSQVREQIPSISLGTVYKNIRIFVEHGLLREVSPLHETLRLDANLTPHHHLVCVRCKRVEDFAGDLAAPVSLPSPLPGGFRAERCHLEITGVCADCQTTEDRAAAGPSHETAPPQSPAPRP